MSDLREDLDRAVRTVPFGDAPVERAKRDGRKIRIRRRVALVVGALAVVAVAAGYPTLAGSSAAPPAPATGRSPHGSYDPKLTDGPGGKATQTPGGLASASGVIASGTMGGVRWQVTVYGPNKVNPVPADPCFMASVALVGVLGGNCDDLPPATGLAVSSGSPVSFSGTSDDAATEATVGEAAADVTYVIVNFSDGQQLKLIPVTAHGHRYVAWVAPLTMTVTSVVAHLGAPYNDSGQTATAIPYDPSGQMPVFGQWQRPGQPVPVRAVGVIGGGVASGPVNWSVLAHVGPWGACMEFTTTGRGPGGYYCVPLAPLSTVAILGPVPFPGPGLQVMFVAAPAGTARVRIALSNGKVVTARPATVGGDRLATFLVTGSATPAGWTTYNAAGHQLGTSTISSASASSAPAAKP